MSDSKIKRILSLMSIFGCVIIAAVFTWYQYNYYHAPHIVSFSDYKEIEDIEYNYDVNSIETVNRDYDRIKGWIIAKGHGISKFNTQVVLYKEGEEEGLAWHTSMERRDDVTKAINDDVDYSCSGFQALIPEKYASENAYEIALIFYIDNDQYLVRTGEEYTLTEGEK